MGSLTALQIKNAKAGRHADGEGLYLLVSPAGTKSWVLRIQFAGKRHDYGLGSANDLGLADARVKAGEWRRIARTGRNPAKEAKEAVKTVPTFAEVALEFHRSTKTSWKNAKHADQWINTLRTYAFPHFGDRAVAEVDASAIQAAVLPIWQSKAETARRVRQRIATVLDYAMAKGYRESEAPMRAVATLLKAVKQPRKGHFAAMPYRDVPAFMEKVAEPQTAGRLALRLLILTAARSGEIRGARWGEFDLESAVWTVPGERMKMGQEHQVPLSLAAIDILKAIRPASYVKGSLLFKGLRGRPLSDMTLTKALRANDDGNYTVHGFRSSFRDWAAENGFNNDWAEAALSHEVSNPVEAAYRRTKFLEQRRGLMQIWADFCLSPGSDEK